jgi:hypothetical protein
MHLNLVRLFASQPALTSNCSRMAHASATHVGREPTWHKVSMHLMTRVWDLN